MIFGVPNNTDVHFLAASNTRWPELIRDIIQDDMRNVLDYEFDKVVNRKLEYFTWENFTTIDEKYNNRESNKWKKIQRVVITNRFVLYFTLRNSTKNYDKLLLIFWIIFQGLDLYKILIEITISLHYRNN